MNSRIEIPQKILIIGCDMGLILLVNIGMMAVGPEFRPPSPSDVSDVITNANNSTHRPPHPPGSLIPPPITQMFGIIIPVISLTWIAWWARSHVANKDKIHIPDSKQTKIGIGITLSVTSVTLWPLIFGKGFFSNLPDMSWLYHVLGVLAVLVPTVGIGYLLHNLTLGMKEHEQHEEE